MDNINSNEMKRALSAEQNMATANSLNNAENLNGGGYNNSLPEAERLYQQGLAYAEGKCLTNGVRDYLKAKELLEKAKDAKHSKAYNALAYYHMMGLFTGDENFDSAEEILYQKKRDFSDKSISSEDFSKNSGFPNCEKFLEELKGAGDVKASYLLIELYYKEKNDYKKQLNSVEINKCIEMIKKSDNVWAMIRLANFYLDHNYKGMYKTAENLLNKAAELKSFEAYYSLGKGYTSGKFLTNGERDVEKAKDYFEKAKNEKQNEFKNSNNVAALIDLADFYMRKPVENLQEAEDLLKSAREACKEDGVHCEIITRYSNLIRLYMDHFFNRKNRKISEENEYYERAKDLYNNVVKFYEDEDMVYKEYGNVLCELTYKGKITNALNFLLKETYQGVFSSQAQDFSEITDVEGVNKLFEKCKNEFIVFGAENSVYGRVRDDLEEYIRKKEREKKYNINQDYGKALYELNRAIEQVLYDLFYFPKECKKYYCIPEIIFQKRSEEFKDVYENLDDDKKKKLNQLIINREEIISTNKWENPIKELDIETYDIDTFWNNVQNEFFTADEGSLIYLIYLFRNICNIKKVLKERERLELGNFSSDYVKKTEDGFKEGLVEYLEECSANYEKVKLKLLFDYIDCYRDEFRNSASHKPETPMGITINKEQCEAAYNLALFQENSIFSLIKQLFGEENLKNYFNSFNGNVEEKSNSKTE